jgi:hypothetical protein
VSTLQVGFKGTMNALFLQDLADKTRRGLRGRVEDGRSAGGVSYGWRSAARSLKGTVAHSQSKTGLTGAECGRYCACHCNSDEW